MTRRVVWLALALAAPLPAAGYCRTRTQPLQPDPTRCPTGGDPIAWPGGCVSVRLNPTVTAPGISAEQLLASLEESARAWKTVVCDAVTRAAPTFELVVGANTTAAVGYNEGGANSNVVTFRARWGDDEFHDPRAAAITVVTFGSRSASILDADTELNLRASYPYSLDGGPGTTDLRTVLVHELGHAQGLAHSPDRSAVMWYTAGQGERRRTPNADDVQGICAVYPPTRAVRCDPEVRGETLEGGGVGCATSPRRAAPVALCALVAVAIAARRRMRGRRSPSNC